jgi:hypothetical protein
MKNCTVEQGLKHASDVFDNTNGMSNVRRLMGQRAVIGEKRNFTSGRRPCCQKRHLLKLTNVTSLLLEKLVELSEAL